MENHEDGTKEAAADDEAEIILHFFSLFCVSESGTQTAFIWSGHGSYMISVNPYTKSISKCYYSNYKSLLYRIIRMKFFVISSIKAETIYNTQKRSAQCEL